MRIVPVLKKAAVLTLGVLLLCGSGLTYGLQAQEMETRRILVLYSFPEGLPWEKLIDENLRATLASKSTFLIELHTEHTDRLRNSDDVYLHKLIDFYQYKYSDSAMDLIIGFGDEAVDILLDYGDELFPQIPMVFVTAERQTLRRDYLNPNTVSLFWGLDIKTTIDLIGEILPQTRHVFIVAGTSITSRATLKLARKSVQGHTQGFAIHYLTDITVEEVIRRSAQLPEHSALFFLPFMQDAGGKSIVMRDMLSVVSQQANGPVFGMADVFIGHGIVGGCLMSAELQGKRGAQVALRILEGQTLEEIGHRQIPNILMFDWRQLKRWDIDEDRLPAGSIVRYREPSIWADHTWEIVGVTTFCLIESLLIVGLLLQGKQRRRAELAAKKHREELTHVARRATLGEVTASLAHELNQPLTAILTSAQAARRFLSRPAPDLDRVNTILDYIAQDDRRASEIIRRLRALLGKGELQVKALDINRLIRDAAILMKNYGTIENVQIVMELAAGLPSIMGDKIQLEQVMLNLVLNGYDAMRDVDHGPHEMITITTKHDDRMVKVSVQDVGSGVDPEDLERVFEPYHTTKPEGLGMGLSISRSIIEAHEGRLWAENNPDRGMTFSFTVPFSKQME